MPILSTAFKTAKVYIFKEMNIIASILKLVCNKIKLALEFTLAQKHWTLKKI